LILANPDKILILADYCTVWLHNSKTHQLWTIVAHGIGRVMVPDKSGFIGHSFFYWLPIIVKDSYEDEQSITPNRNSEAVSSQL
jgi:hypothetical protein